ncbi:MAG: hypothetical protein MI922_06765, partial [Bacteroidales bacterium]|nr:hypothetical protein [Bacteroidales bacterium]
MKEVVRNLTVVLFIILSITNVKSQEEASLKEMFIEAETFYLFEEYKDALPLYQRIYRQEPENYNVCFKIGICYLNDHFNREKSIKYLEKASRNVTDKFKTNNFKEKLAPVEAVYYLGLAYRKNGLLKKAIEHFEWFKQEADSSVFHFDIVDEEIASCKYAFDLKKNKVGIRKQKKLGGVNTRFSEINPVLSGNGKVLVFTRKLPFYDAVFISNKKLDNSWSEPHNLVEEFGVDGNTYSCGLSYKGDEIYVYRSDDYDGNIYVSKGKGKKYSRLQKLNENINTKYWESHASPSADGKMLFFTSNRKG